MTTSVRFDTEGLGKRTEIVIPFFNFWFQAR